MNKKKVHKNVVIIGAGIAGLTAGIYSRRMNQDTLILESDLVGGQIIYAEHITNYPGFNDISGKDLMANIESQALAVGVEIDEFNSINSVDFENKIIDTENYTLSYDALIIATGMNRRKLPLKEEPKYLNRGIHYCELCDGYKYKDKTIAIIGGSYSAINAVNILSKYSNDLYLIHRRDSFRVTDAFLSKVVKDTGVKIIRNSNIIKLNGDSKLESIE